MKRIRVHGSIILAAFLLLSVSMPAFTAQISVVNSKHNLSSGGTGAIRSLAPGSGGTDQVCVFCHTPHSANPIEAPLWNKTNPSVSYTVYASDVMSYLSITPEQPLTGAIHVKSRICLSCHDGTIALGSLVNAPYGLSGDVAMQGTAGGFMPSTARGWIGTDIRDDHPIAVAYDTTKDPELQAVSGAIRLYRLNAGRVISDPLRSNGSFVECTSCHDAHDNQYGKFLVQSNQNSAVCTSCHTKTGYFSILPNESVHTNSTVSYAPPTGAGDPANPQTLGSTVGSVRCMVCHFPHKAGVALADPTTPNEASGRYLLTYQEEQSCFNTTNRWGQANTACHGTGGSGKNIRDEVLKGSAHHVGNYSGMHRATEGRSGPNWTNNEAGSGWHVECDDCHNVHTAGGLVHSNGTNAVTTTSPIYGAGGVEPSWPAAWNSPNTYTYKEPIGVTTNPTSTIVTHEYQVCLKCHSTFAWNTPPGGMTDQGKEFNINNASYHSVVRVNPLSFGTTSWTGGSGFNDTTTMYCSDCHGNNSPSPVGPHGSLNAFLLKRPFSTTYTAKGTDQDLGDICFSCHDPVAYQTGSDTTPGTGFRTTTGINLHTRHRGLALSSPLSSFGYKCVNCHTKIPHGYKNKALVVLGADGADVATYASGGAAKISSWTPAAALNYGGVKTDNCSTVAGCH